MFLFERVACEVSVSNFSPQLLPEVPIVLSLKTRNTRTHTARTPQLRFYPRQDQVTPEVQTLLALKADYKAATGRDWKPGAHQPAAAAGGAPAPAATPAAPAASPAAPAPGGGGGSPDEINEQIVQQGSKVRQLKQDKAPKVSWGKSCQGGT